MTGDEHTPSTESLGKRHRDMMCGATTKAGHPCHFPAMRDGGGFCWTHSPATTEQRRAARRLGGRRATEKRRALLGQIDFTSAEGVRSFLEGLTAAAITDTIPSSKARDVAAIAEAALRVRAGIELGDRLETLEGTIGRLVAEQSEGGPL